MGWRELKFDPAGLKDQFGMIFKNAQPRLGSSQDDHMTNLAVNKLIRGRVAEGETMP